MSPLCSRNARPQKDEEGVARCPPCSQNAHDETVLVRCAQSRAALATPLEGEVKIGKDLAWAKSASRRAQGWWVRMARAVGDPIQAIS
jgi:hypothetical protein